MAKKTKGSKINYPTSTGSPGKSQKAYRQETGETLDDGLGFFNPEVGKNNADYLKKMSS